MEMDANEKWSIFSFKPDNNAEGIIIVSVSGALALLQKMVQVWQQVGQGC